MTRHADQIRLNVAGSLASLQAAKDLLLKAQYNAAVSSAAQSAFHSASALLLDEGIEPGQHGDVITLMQEIFVNGRRLTREQGEKLSWLFQIGEAAKSDAAAPLLPGEAQKAVEFAESFFDAAKVILEG
jgi:uncharacterized protein (UPF0332 family)